MHPLEVCDFDPSLLEGINPYDTKQLMSQLCINKMKLGLDGKDVFNDENFVNKVRFHKTESVLELPFDISDIWKCRPNISSCEYIIIPDIKHSPGTYVCKSVFNGKTYIEHFILLNSILPYISFRVEFCTPYAEGIYSCVQKHIEVNKRYLSDHQQTALVKYLTCETDHLDFELDFENPNFTFNVTRIATEIFKRIAHV